ncbi:WbuC family cupin fold metalloprotein [Catenovulum sp. SX2]|uniref:WbuC family cupin fold metalloprotein n=1 Tax=Catenovulum sp. SX2 TaxID=3398614 RepID=UPI003F8324DA
MKVFDQSELTNLNQAAAESSRKRSNLNWHSDYTAAVQRLFISMQPDSYVRPHKHVEANKWECFVVLQGKLLFVTYKPDGSILDKIYLGPEQTASVVEIPPGVWHSTVALQANTTFFEIKEGPYTPINDKGFASWAPEEGSPEAHDYIQWLIHAKVTERWSRAD